MKRDQFKAEEIMITLRRAQDIHQAEGAIENGTFHGRWHFSFDDYYDPGYTHFGSLRVFNDDTLSPAAVWPLHPHRNIEVITYCALGEFRHADENGKNGVLKKGWVQHTTVGRGMLHSEINNLADQAMRFIQMWFLPNKKDLMPSVQQKQVEKRERTNVFLPLVSNKGKNVLNIASDAVIYSSFLEEGREVSHEFEKGEGGYLYVIEGSDVTLNNNPMKSMDAAIIKNEQRITIKSGGGTELLLVVMPLV